MILLCIVNEGVLRKLCLTGVPSEPWILEYYI